MKILLYAFVRGSGGGAPRSLKIFKNRTRKSNGNQEFLEKFHEFRDNFFI